MGRLTHKARYQAGYKANKDVHVWECIDKLGQLEELEEQGRLLKLPCTVGDKLYRIDTDPKIKDREVRMEVYEIDNICICNDGRILFMPDPYDEAICELENIVTDAPYLDYYRIFLSKSEAENALKALEG